MKEESAANGYPLAWAVMVAIEGREHTGGAIVEEAEPVPRLAQTSAM